MAKNSFLAELKAVWRGASHAQICLLNRLHDLLKIVEVFIAE